MACILSGNSTFGEVVSQNICLPQVTPTFLIASRIKIRVGLTRTLARKCQLCSWKKQPTTKEVVGPDKRRQC